VYSFQAVVPLPEGPVYLPPHHEGLLRRIYSNLDLQRKLRKSHKDSRLADLSVMIMSLKPVINMVWSCALQVFVYFIINLKRSQSLELIIPGSLYNSGLPVLFSF
jgi:hypothetical protein